MALQRQPFKLLLQSTIKWINPSAELSKLAPSAKILLWAPLDWLQAPAYINTAVPLQLCSHCHS